jgi:muramidase (phage lysozyme)
MSKDYPLGKLLVHSTIILWLVFILMSLRGQKFVWNGESFSNGTVPLVMSGGDPHIRALMRTISASESNVPNPYAVIYGGDYTSDLSHHPDRCVSIAVGPNSGRCSTAAGRYQFLTTTWGEKARIYHPQPVRFMMWESYSFEPQYQDAVVYAWLDDPKAWGQDLRSMLQQGNLEEVLQHLSPTWTSLGYGIETNSMSSSLPTVYQKMLQEELAIASKGNGAMPVSQQSAPQNDRPVMN